MDEFDSIINFDNELKIEADLDAIVMFEKNKALEKARENAYALGSEIGYYYGFIEQLNEESLLFKQANSIKKYFH